MTGFSFPWCACQWPDGEDTGHEPKKYPRIFRSGFHRMKNSWTLWSYGTSLARADAQRIPRVAEDRDTNACLWQVRGFQSDRDLQHPGSVPRTAVAFTPFLPNTTPRHRRIRECNVIIVAPLFEEVLLMAPVS